MQLILNSETELGLNSKMSALDEESLDEKLVYDDMNDIKNGDIPSMQKELILDGLDEKLTNVEYICQNSDNKSIGEVENIKSVNNVLVENLENKIPVTNSINDTMPEETRKNNLSQEIKYDTVFCENIDQTLESQKSIIDDESMDLVLQKEAEILDDQECVEDLISLAKEISKSNEKINIDSNIEERSALEIRNTDTLAEENISVLINNKQNIDALNDISEAKNDLEVEISIKGTSKVTTDKIKKNTELEDEQQNNYPNENIDKVETESDNKQNSCAELNCNDIKTILNIEQENNSEENNICSENVADNPRNLSQKTEVTKEDTDVLMKEDANNDKEHKELDTDEITTFERNTSNIFPDPSQNSNQLRKEEPIGADEANIVDEDIKNKSNFVNNQKSDNETVFIAEDTNTEKKYIKEVLNDVNDIKPNDEPITENTEDLQKKIDIESANLLNQVNTKKIDESSIETLESNDVLIEPVIPIVSSTKEKCENKTTDVPDLDSEVAKDVVDVIQTCDLGKKTTKMQDKDEHNSQKLEKKLPILNEEKKDEDVGNLNTEKEENVAITNQEKKDEGVGNLNTEKDAEENLSDNNIDEPMELDTTVNSDTVILKSPTCTKPVPILCGLTNNLDILSDEDDDNNIKQNATSESIPAAKKSIPVEKKITIDEDDIMIIDEDTTGNNSKKNANEIKTETEKVEAEKQISVIVSEDSKTLKEPLEKENGHSKLPGDEKEAEAPAVGEMIVQPEISEKSFEHENKKIKSQKPLLSENFLSTCKKNFAHMTRDDLEEFCILKIVESVVDRSSLSEIKNKIKNMSQSLEEYKKKAMTLTKQNRDLQVVLKSVQEEQKKRTGAPITPLKITRSVGMQILMTEPSRRKGAGAIMIPVTVSNGNTNNSIITNNSNTRQLRNTTNQNQRTPKTNNVQQIPVPRLVPASNNLATKTPSTANTNNAKTNSPSPIPNGIKTPTPTQKPPEKRAYNRISLSPSSVTVDLTDDEPPLKVTARSPTVAPVRLVPPQNLMAPQRPQFGQQVNSPRKVYIPISGPQGNVRPGQSIMLKPLPPQGPRARGPGPGAVVRPPQAGIRRGQGVRHPAPLPDAMKQYQPPNWKALPPAPDLKLSKVENGIVISWKIEGYQEDSYEEIASYQLYAYQETSSPPSTALWKKIGDVKALPLPMACTLTQFMAGYKYYFAVRAVDIRSRVGPFSLPGSILLLSKT